MSRGATAFEIFQGGVQPVESVLGESRHLGHRTSLTNVFVIVELSVPVSVKSALGQNPCPDSVSGLDLNDFTLRTCYLFYSKGYELAC